MSERPPERIYLQWPEGDPDCAGEAFGGATWCGDRINPQDVEYVRSDVVARLTAERDDARRRLAEVEGLVAQAAHDSRMMDAADRIRRAYRIVRMVERYAQKAADAGREGAGAQP